MTKRDCGAKAKLLSILTVTILLTACGKNQQTASTVQPSAAANQPAQLSTAQPATPEPANGYPTPGQPAASTPTPSAAGPTPAPASYPQQPTQIAAPVPAVATYRIPPGTLLRVRIDRRVDTKRDRAGERFTATLNTPVAIDGREALPRGTPFTGHLTYAAHSGRFKGRAMIGLTLDSFTVDGEIYPIDTRSDVRRSKGHKKRNFLFIGGGAGGGAAIGAMAGGPAGALIGAGVGAGAGATTAFFTGRKNVSIPAETLLTFHLRQSVNVSEQDAVAMSAPAPAAR